MARIQVASNQRFLGADLGAETLKLVELLRLDGQWQIQRRCRLEHGKEPQLLLNRLYREWNAVALAGAALTGRLGRQFSMARVPLQQAQSRAFRFLYPNTAGTLVSVGSHGFSVLEVRSNGREVFRENSRCSQGTGNFLRQLTERFSLTVEEASALCADVEHAAALSGRCPVILKTDMTHLANKGGNRAEILAGLFDAVCENVLNLIKPGLQPRSGRIDRRGEPVAACATDIPRPAGEVRLRSARARRGRPVLGSAGRGVAGRRTIVTGTRRGATVCRPEWRGARTDATAGRVSGPGATYADAALGDAQRICSRPDPRP